jgi:hypothetical protein
MGCYTNVIEAYGIQPRDIYNMDETGFRIGQGKRVEGVYTKYPQRAPSASSIDSASQRKLVTSVECIFQDGWVLPPLIIMPGDVQMRDWYELVTLPPAYIIGISSTGYINMELAYLWLHHFHISTRPRQFAKYRLLIFDQHKSHMTRDFMSVAESLQILCLPLIPHLTHLLQPLDSIPFLQAKKAHADAVNKASWLSGINYDKVHFLSFIKEIRNKAFTPKIIAAGWKETGLYPFDIDRIIKKIGAFEDQETLLQMLDGENSTRNISDVHRSTGNDIQSETKAGVVPDPAPAAAPLPGLRNLSIATTNNSTNCTFYWPNGKWISWSV